MGERYGASCAECLVFISDVDVTITSAAGELKEVNYCLTSTTTMCCAQEVKGEFFLGSNFPSELHSIHEV